MSMRQWNTSTLIATMTGITTTSTIPCQLDPTVIDISTYPFGTHIRMYRTSTTLIATRRALIGAFMRWQGRYHGGSRDYGDRGGRGVSTNGCHNNARMIRGIPIAAGTSQ